MQSIVPFPKGELSILNKTCIKIVFDFVNRAVTDPRDGRRVALKKLPNVFQSLVSSKRVFRELKMLCFFKHENVLSALDILQPPSLDFFQEMYPFYRIDSLALLNNCYRKRSYDGPLTVN
ncbi:hypothetical protein SFRURICE_001761, partial [Spodoptera frugiperda]